MRFLVTLSTVRRYPMPPHPKSSHRTTCVPRLPALVLLALLFPAASSTAQAQAGFEPSYIENWLFFQRNENGSDQWKYEPRLYIPYRFDNGGTFLQRVDVPLIDTNNSGPGNPDGGWSGGIGDVFVEEIFVSPEVAKNFKWKASVRFVFPTGKQKPFGSSQYQWAPGGGFIYEMPDVLGGVTLTPYARWFSGFAPTADKVTEVRTLDLYPAATFALPERWSLLLYPDNPITYNHQKGTWFVPLDLMLARKVDRTLEFGIGGAVKLGHPSDPSYRYIVDGRLIVYF